MTISPPSVVNSLLQGLPPYVKDPPIEAVCFAFGVNEDGQLGIDAAGSLTTPKVLEALLGTRLRGRAFGRTPLIAGSRNSVALSADGDVFSWGWNARGTLGHGHRDPVPKPRRVAGLRGVPIVQVALGGWHTLYLDEHGQVYASGGDEYNQCGQGAQARDVLVPTLALPTLRVCAVSAGGMHSLALTEDGQIWQWGEPWGAFSMTIDRTPRRVLPESDPAGSDAGGGGADDPAFVAIACGAFHNLALTDDGRLFSWGLNDYGQLGLGHTASATHPCRVVEGLEGVTVAHISCGGWHSGLLTTAGECLMFGRGEYGRLGLGDKAGSSRLRPTKVWTLEGTRVVQLSCGGSHTMAVTADGKGLAWGRGSFGRLGTGEERVAAAPLEIPLPGGPERWHTVAVAAGGRHSLVYALPDTGELGERAAGAAARRRSPMGLSPQSSTANVLQRAFEAAGGAAGAVARRGRHLDRGGGEVAAGGEATEEADDELGSSDEAEEEEAEGEEAEEEEEDDDSFGSSDEATMAAGAEAAAPPPPAPIVPAVVGTPVESLIARAAEALTLGDDRVAAQMAHQEPYLDVSPGRSTAAAVADEGEERDEELEGGSREAEGDERDAGEEGADEEDSTEGSEGGKRAQLRRAAARAAATVHGLRDDLLGDRS